MIEIRKYRHTRHWAVYVDGELLAVVVYRKGAEAIADMLRNCSIRQVTIKWHIESLFLIPKGQPGTDRR